VVDVDTAPEDLGTITGAVAIKASLTFPLSWKGGGAFYDLPTAADLDTIAEAALGHVQAAYDAEKAAHAKIDDDTDTTRAEVLARFNGAL